MSVSNTACRFVGGSLRVVLWCMQCSRPIVDGVCKHRSGVEVVSLDRYLLTANKGVSVGSKKKRMLGP